MLLGILCMISVPVYADDAIQINTEWVSSPYGSVRLISGVRGVGDDKVVPLGVEFKLPQDWKIYHKDSGDAGLPPVFINKNSKNVILSDWFYPMPIAFEFAGIKTLGYKDAVILPWDIQVKNNNEPIIIDGTIEYLSCAKICVPVRADIYFRLKKGVATTTPHFMDIAKYRSSIDLPVGAISSNLDDNTFDVQANILVMILIAFIGGLILNIMPCVLPVLSLKTISIIQSIGKGRNAIRIEMLFMALGIVFTFLLMAVILSILKTLGYNFGWGIQFQQPMFLSIMMIVMIVFSGNTFGVFHINVPKVSMHLPFLHSDISKAFYNGVLATVLATPCSAPFLGTAVGFALASDVIKVVYIFMSLGLGMALPYIALGLFPAWTKYMPKPGYWMVYVKSIMGVAMMATALYLGWILSLSIGVESTVMIGLISVMMIVVLGLNYASKLYKVRYLVCALLLFAGLFIGSSNINKTMETYDDKWQAFEPSLIEDLIAEDKIVFVDITASWCITCKVNKLIALDTDSVQAILSGSDVVAIRGDWTHPDAVISSYLQRYNRFGIPFNIVYSKKYPNGFILPEILTSSIVINAIENAK